MKLFLISYAGAAILVPAMWIGARLWIRRRSQTPPPGLVSAQIIPFPVAMRSVIPTARARPRCETNGQRLTRNERKRLRKADQYVAVRRLSLSE
jgi:hypothetical protein